MVGGLSCPDYICISEYTEDRSPYMQEDDVHGRVKDSGQQIFSAGSVMNSACLHKYIFSLSPRQQKTLNIVSLLWEEITSGDKRRW